MVISKARPEQVIHDRGIALVASNEALVHGSKVGNGTEPIAEVVGSRTVPRSRRLFLTFQCFLLHGGEHPQERLPALSADNDLLLRWVVVPRDGSKCWGRIGHRLVRTSTGSLREWTPSSPWCCAESIPRAGVLPESVCKSQGYFAEGAIRTWGRPLHAIVRFRDFSDSPASESRR
jgi:hypothetical protein